VNAQLVASATGKYTTTCKLCRRDVAESPSLDIPVIGDPGKRAGELMTVLLKHLMKYHARELKAGSDFANAIAKELPAFMIMHAFIHEDPSVGPRLESTRAPLFAMMRKNSMTDASLEHIVAGFGLDPDDAVKVNEAMKAVRDACCEFGEFAPKTQEPPRIIPV
jgi:hypothetical protein